MATTLATLPTIIVTAIKDFLSGLGSAVVDFFQELFLTNTGTTSAPVWELSTFAYVSIVFMGVGIAISLSALIFHLIRKRRVG